MTAFQAQVLPQVMAPLAGPSHDRRQPAGLARRTRPGGVIEQERPQVGLLRGIGTGVAPLAPGLYQRRQGGEAPDEGAEGVRGQPERVAERPAAIGGAVGEDTDQGRLVGGGLTEPAGNGDGHGFLLPVRPLAVMSRRRSSWQLCCKLWRKPHSRCNPRRR